MLKGSFPAKLAVGKSLYYKELRVASGRLSATRASSFRQLSGFPASGRKRICSKLWDNSKGVFGSHRACN
jgi:hypothetical protein